MLVEKYRPSSWTDVIGQDKVVLQLLALRDRAKLSGRAYWISGQSGTGKTTIAKLIAAEVADEFNTVELDAGLLTATDLEEIEREMATYGLGVKNGRAYLINEAHGLRKAAIRQLLVLLDRIAKYPHVVIVFTTTLDGQKSMFEDYDDADPLLSRCTRYKLSQRDLAQAFAERAKAIAESEGLDGRPA